MRHVRPSLLALILVLAAGSARADQVDDFIRAQMKAQNIPGLTLAIVQDGTIVKTEGYGLADRRRNIAAKPETGRAKLPVASVNLGPRRCVFSSRPYLLHRM